MDFVCLNKKLNNQTISKNSNSCIKENVDDTNEKQLYDRETFHETFNTEAYLRDFYTNVDDPAMQMVLFFLPNIVARLENQQSLLDFGAGPTIHSAVCFRNKVQEIYLADFLPQNLNELKRWQTRCSNFNWEKVLKIIINNEGLNILKNKSTLDLEEITRKKIKEILFCNCHKNPSLVSKYRKKFDIITTFYTLEYCCKTLNEYRLAITNIASLLNPNGYFILSSILEENWCSFDNKKFTCLFITKEFVFDCLKESNLIEYSKNTSEKILLPIVYEVNGMIIVCCKKKC